MDNKDKIIEEMAKVIDDRLIEARGYLGSMNRGEGYWIAQKLVEHYQPKLPENSVVLSREELNEIIKRTKETEKNYYKKVVIPQERKETAEKFLNMIYWKAVKHIKGKNKDECFIEMSFEKLDKIAKEQFGVEIKE